MIIDSLDINLILGSDIRFDRFVHKSVLKTPANSVETHEKSLLWNMPFGVNTVKSTLLGRYEVCAKIL